MKNSTRNLQATRIAFSAALGMAALLLVGCPRTGDRSVAESEGPVRLDAAAQPATAEAARAAEARALEQRLAEVAEAEAEALAAAEQALAEREAVLKLREEQTRKEEALRQERERMAKRRAEVEERERQLAAKERELENFETNLVFQEKELEDRETELEETLEAIELLDEAEPFEAERAEAEAAAERFEEDGTVIQTRPAYASLEPGRLLEVEFEETVSSATHRRGDRFKGRLVQDLTAEDGTLVVPAGTEVVGRVVEATPLKRVGGQATLEVEFTHLVLSPQETVAISASFVELGSDKRKDKKKIAGAAIVGAILGRVLGGDGAEGVLAGAAAGAAAGTIAVTRGQGEEARIEKGQSVALQLEEVVTVEIQMTGPADR